MRTEIKNNGITDITVLYADKGKILRRIETGEIVGYEFWLGKSYYIGGVLQDPPHDDVVSDFDEIDVFIYVKQDPVNRFCVTVPNTFPRNILIQNSLNEKIRYTRETLL